MSLKGKTEVFTDSFIENQDASPQGRDLDLGSLAALVNKDKVVSACNCPEEGRPNPGEVEPNREWELKAKATKKKWP